jgi:hypothetical protein
MTRYKEIKSFLEHEYLNRTIIEPDSRYTLLRERLMDSLKTNKPDTVIKIGIGNPELLFDIIERFEITLCVVESSFKTIGKFIEEYGDRKGFSKIYIINGDFQILPIDYFVADMIISIDYLDFIDSARAIDEYRLSLEFESVLFVGVIVLNDSDVEGVFDDYMRMIFPLHNDYYLESDLNTVMGLNEFKLLNMETFEIRMNLADMREYMIDYFGDTGEYDPEFIEKKLEVLDSLYLYDDETVTLPYFTGTFMRKKTESIDGTL